MDLRISEEIGFELVEAAGQADPFNDDGTVDMVLIRPCRGKGPGGHIYTAEMLEAHHGVFANRPMFDNHESIQAKRARGGLPRSPSELGGFVRETRWDPNYRTPRDQAEGFGPGAVIGRCSLSDLMESLVRKMPEALKCSVNAQATKKRPGTWKGKKGMIVEGIQDHPETSVDLVTIAGAGGQVARIMEAMHTDEPVVEAPGTEQLREIVREELAGLLQGPEFIETVGEMIGAAVGAVGGELQEALVETRRQVEVTDLAAHAARVIDGLALVESAKRQLRDEFVGPGSEHRLELVEAIVAENGETQRSARQVLEAQIEEQAARYREIAAAANPSTPLSRTTPPGVQVGSALREAASQGAEASVPEVVQNLVDMGIPVDHLIKLPTTTDGRHARRLA